MKKLMTLGLSLVSASALALEDPPRTNSTTWEIYGFVLLVFVVGFIWVWFQQKKERDRQSRRQRAAGSGGS